MNIAEWFNGLSMGAKLGVVWGAVFALAKN